jgi:hypothetical protein
MKAKIVNMDGEQQANFLDAPVIDCKFLPSKKALEFRLSQTVDLIMKGDMDYARYNGWDGLKVEKKDKHLTDMVLINGEWYRWAQVGAIKRFMATWEGRRAYLMDDCRDLQKSIALAE